MLHTMKKVLLLVCLTAVSFGGVYDWMDYDHFDDIIDKMEAVNADNCESKSRDELHLRINIQDAVSQIVLTNQLRTSKYEKAYWRNRTALLQLHQVALTNAYKYSYLFQRQNESWNFNLQPSLFYYYLGLTADVTANNGMVNGSGILFDGNKFFPNFLENVPFNQTVPLFGPRAWRIDDYNDPSNWLREPTNNTFQVTDYGAGPFRNYNETGYKTNVWYNLWFQHPDIAIGVKGKGTGREFDSLIDPVTVRPQYSRRAGEFTGEPQGFEFFGPIVPEQDSPSTQQAVLFTPPYFDCGRSDKWIVTATAPIVDRLWRYMYDTDTTNTSGVWEHLKNSEFVGVSTADVDFLEIDFNPCASNYNSEGKAVDGKNYLNGTARCHDTTRCQPLPGFGFQRGGYICECKPGFRYPEYIQGPYLGVAIEVATRDEYEAGFQCLPIGDQFVIPSKNAEEGDTGGDDRISGSVGKRRKRSADTAEKTSEKPQVEKEESVKNKEKTTLYSDSSTRFLRKVIPRNYNTLKEIEEAYLKRRRVGSLDHIDPYYLAMMRKNYHDKNQRNIVARLDKSTAATLVKEKEKKLKRKKRNTFNPAQFNRVRNIFDYMNSITSENCKSRTDEELQLPGDVKFGVEKSLERFGRTALRLADFLSSFLQNVDGKQDYGILKGDRPFTEEQLFAEVISVVLADPDVEGLGLYYDTDQFQDRQTGTRQRFAPYAYAAKTLETGGKDSYSVVDRAGETKDYTTSAWFEQIKKRWAYSTRGLEKYVLNPWIRSTASGENLRKHEDYPLVWYSAGYDDGVWSDPWFDCDGYLKKWLISYRVPFFGNSGYGTATQFRGVVSIDISLDLLDINQCPSEFFMSNAFMASAQCDYETTYCIPIENQGFRQHNGYRCDCKQGFEFPWKGLEYFYTGDTIFQENKREAEGLKNRHDRMKCRMSDANKVILNTLLLTITALVTLHFT